MSYCRKGSDSDLYLIRTFGGKYDCMGCLLLSGKYDTATLNSTSEAIAHVKKHLSMQHRVPKSLLARLYGELG